MTFVDAADNPVLEPLPGEVRLWRSTRVQALFAAGMEPERIVIELAIALDIPLAEITVTQVEDRAWEREWLRDFHAMRFGRRLWVCPRHELVADAGAAVVRLDPGLAFGTGTHPTTAMCLEWLDAHLARDERVIDYGCGSGILGIAAVKLGAHHAHCFDIDPQARLATTENARANAVESQVIVCDRADMLPRQVEVLMANILSAPLCELAPSVADLVRPGGRIVLAGLLGHEAHDVTQAYRPWFDMAPFGDREGWVGLWGKRGLPAPRY